MDGSFGPFIARLAFNPAIFVIFWVYKLWMTPKQLPLPPSPTADPIIGHLRYVPTQYEEEVYKSWSDELGSDIISLKIPGQVIIVLNSIKQAEELLSKRSSIYSNRPQIPMISSPNLTGWGKGSGALDYGERWKAQRKWKHDVLNKKASEIFWPTMEQEVHFTMRRILDNPGSENLIAEISRMTGCTILSAAYGYRATSMEDPLLNMVKTGVRGFSQAVVPANFLVNFFPFLEIIPSWLPGAGWKRLAQTWRSDKEAMINTPYEWSKQQMASGIAQPSIVSTLLENLNSKGLDPSTREEQEDQIKWATGSLFGAASDTSASAILIAILAMVCYPEVQSKARQELDDVVGDERLPKIADRERMPYMSRVVKEVFRWKSSTPTGIAHSCAQNDTYLGYHIPKGSIMAMSNDPQVYPEPSRFNPDRFLDPAVPDAPAFGFGRRICPGAHFAEATVFITLSTLLSIFDLHPGCDEEGKPMPPDTRMTPDSLIRFPLNFRCTMIPRSEERERLLLQS